MTFGRPYKALFLALALWPLPLRAQVGSFPADPPRYSGVDGQLRAEPPRISDPGISVDGSLEEPAWDRAAARLEVGFWDMGLRPA